MKRFWSAFTTLFTVTGIAALITALLLWKLGYLNERSLARALGVQEKATQGEVVQVTEVPKPKQQVEKPSERPEPEELRAWVQRLEELQRDVAWKQAEALSELQIAERRKERMQKAATALAELLVLLFPGENMPDGRRLLEDPSALQAVTERLRRERSRIARLPQLCETLQEMRQEEAAALVGEGLSTDLAALVLRALDGSTRAAILGYLARKNPAKAGELFKKLAQQTETQGG